MPPVRSRTVLERLDKLKAKARKKVRGSDGPAAKPPPDAPTKPPPAPPSHRFDHSTSPASDSPVSVHHAPAPTTTAEPDGLWESLLLPLGALSTAVTLGAATTAGVELSVDTSSGSSVPLRIRKHNQDCFAVVPRFAGSRDSLLAAVYDGHGIQGGEVSRFTRDIVPAVLSDAMSAHMARCGGPLRHNLPPEERRRAYLRLFTKAFSEAERALKEDLHDINHEYSGTTATCVWLDGADLFVAWVGDSRAILGMDARNGEGSIHAVDLTWDQKPVRDDEKKRVRDAGARVTRWKKGVGPQRVWLPDEWLPGLAMTRSIGDTVLTQYGVVPSPEVTMTRLADDACFVVAASDGVWEFMSTDDVAQMVGRLKREGECPETAARELVNEAVRRWTEKETVVDDTTAVVVYVELGAQGGAVRRGSVAARTQDLQELREYENRSVKELFRRGRDGFPERTGVPAAVAATGRLEIFLPLHEDDDGDGETGSGAE